MTFFLEITKLFFANLEKKLLFRFFIGLSISKLFRFSTLNKSETFY